MKRYPVQLIAFFFASFITLHLVKSEFFTSIAELEKLLQTEEEVAKGLERYLKVEEERLQKVKWLYNQYSKLHSATNQDKEEYLSNPVNAYLLVKHLTTDWKTVNLLIQGHANLTAINDIKFQNLNFPNEDDLKGAATALLRLQDIYLIDAATIARGKIKGTTISSELTAGDCFEMGRQAYEHQEFNHSLHWMEETLSRLKGEEVKTADTTDTIEYMAVSAYGTKNYRYALELTDYLIELDSNRTYVFDNRHHYQDLITEEENNKANVVNMEKVETVTTLDDRFYSGKDEYEKLCRGESLKTPEEQRKLDCYYTSNNNSYLLLQPLKIEVLNQNPRIVVYHDVLKNWEADAIRTVATPLLDQAKLFGGKMGSYRISKTAWLENFHHPLINRINRRVEDITGLDSETAELLHVINYGIGGYYVPHYDYAKPEDEEVGFLKFTGNRIATWIFYLSHVSAGGSTVFPEIGVEVKPVKGAAVFWHNMLRNGDVDSRTLHAACPVLAGSKWVANKWIHEMGNEFRRKCSLDQFE